MPDIIQANKYANSACCCWAPTLCFTGQDARLELLCNTHCMHASVLNFTTQADAKAMPFEDQSFASILDKGTLDALM